MIYVHEAPEVLGDYKIEFLFVTLVDCMHKMPCGILQ